MDFAHAFSNFEPKQLPAFPGDLCDLDKVTVIWLDECDKSPISTTCADLCIAIRLPQNILPNPNLQSQHSSITSALRPAIFNPLQPFLTSSTLSFTASKKHVVPYFNRNNEREPRFGGHALAWYTFELYGH